MTRKRRSVLRGHIYVVDVPDVGRKPVVIVSNNRRNRALDSVLGVRITTAPKPSLASIVPIPAGQPMKGRVLCDDIVEIPKARLKRYAGRFSEAVMGAVDEGLKEALGIAQESSARGDS